MRAKAASFFESGGMGAACKEISMEKAQVSVSFPLPPTAIDAQESHVMSEASESEGKVVSDVVCKTESVESNPRTAVVVLKHFQTVSVMQSMVTVSVGFTASKPKAGNLFFGCEVDTSVRTPNGNILPSFGVPLLRVDDEPPDPGESMIQKQGRVEMKSVVSTEHVLNSVDLAGLPLQSCEKQ
jgi:hypothetical protein